MKKSNAGVQVLAWCMLYIFWVMVFQKRELAFSRTVTIEFCYLIFIAANFYFTIYYSVPRFLYQKKYNSFVLLFFTGILITALLRVPLASYLNQHYFLVNQPQPTFEKIFTASFLNIFIWSFALVAGKLMIDRFQFQQYLDHINRQKEQAELDFLNAQFNPHFLFNSINSIYGHIDKQNTTARNMLLTFSDMLRYQLYDCNSKRITMDKEITYIKNYVAMQKARKESDLIVDLCIDPSIGSFTITPLLFIAFIENAFKYVGMNKNNQNKILISFKNEGDELRFECFNTKGNGIVNNIEHKGIGMSNAKRRLELLYPEKHLLRIDDTDNSYKVDLIISTQ